ncbi:flagellar motility protein MotE (MotC chaperone) [Sphingomonas sp. PvP055]|uniref:MotE family protein n=1 Tax=Sphingomonas sp. PvP055 TaxID=3156391 RepID=UPI00339759B3
MTIRIPLLSLTTAMAGIAAIGNAVAAATPATPDSRLGLSVQQDLATRDRQAASRQQALDLREQAVRASAARIKAELEASRAAATPAGPATAQDAAPDSYTDLASIYQAMKPAKAAVVFEQLDLDVQLKVARKMRERSTGMMLAAMTPKGAARLTMALARAPRATGAR